MPSDKSIQLAAQAWCTPETSHLVMEPALAMAFAEILDCATTPAPADETREALQQLFNMVNSALDARDALLISKTSATMLRAKAVLSAAPADPTDAENDALDAALLNAYHQGVDEAKDAIRTESVSDEGAYFKATFINAIARKCGHPAAPADSVGEPKEK